MTKLSCPSIHVQLISFLFREGGNTFTTENGLNNTLKPRIWSNSNIHCQYNTSKCRRMHGDSESEKWGYFHMQ